MIVISAYPSNPRGWVSHTLRSAQGSILHYVEDNFGLASLGADDAFMNDDLSEFFNFSNGPSQYAPVPTTFPGVAPNPCS